MLYTSESNMFINKKINDYWSVLNIKQTLGVVELIEQLCFNNLRKKMNLFRVLFPNEIFLLTGLDKITGVENFNQIVVPHQTAKWARCAIKRYGISPHEGIIYSAKIKQEALNNDLDYIFENNLCWERILDLDSVGLFRLEKEVLVISEVISVIAKTVLAEYGIFNEVFDSKLQFMTARNLEKLYPNLSPKQRECAVCRKYGVVFIEQIGLALSDKSKHIECFPDVDDWNFNGVLLMWNERFECMYKIAEVGIRVLWNRMVRQFEHCGLSVPNLSFHKLLKQGAIPCTIGGSINLSCLSVLILNKAHVGEVSPGVWDDITLCEFAKRGIHLL